MSVNDSYITPIGCRYLGDNRCDFVIWAPRAQSIELKITSPKKKSVSMVEGDYGYWFCTAENIAPGTQYVYEINHTDSWPDPASHFQPNGVHKPSEVVDHRSFYWQDYSWKNLPINEYIIYEIHPATFTQEGDFNAIIHKLSYLKELGVTAIELMPVAQFPGTRNWGYDGVYHFAVQNSYGGPMGLKYLVDACHMTGLAVILDVVYNHFGPEGNYTNQYGHYFTHKYNTPWGDAINYDDAYSYGVRNYVIQNMLFWFREYHIDSLRLDAIHGIFDMGAHHILEELSDQTALLSAETGRQYYLIAESDLNDVRVVTPKEQGGYGMNAQWCDDFHHAVHTMLTKEDSGYYTDFGTIEHLIKAVREGFVYSWNYSPHRKRLFGNSSAHVTPDRLVACIQNHDQVGNRMLGERLSSLVSFEALKLAAGILLTSPYIPLLFMGEEYAETNPFLYFVDHGDADLINAVREGRKAEFAAFGWKQDPPDAQSETTFQRSMLKWDQLGDQKHRSMLEYYQTLIQLRKDIPALSHPNKKKMEVVHIEGTNVILLRRWHQEKHIIIIMNFSDITVDVKLDMVHETCLRILDSYDETWHSSGSTIPATMGSQQKMTLQPYHFVLFMTENAHNE